MATLLHPGEEIRNLLKIPGDRLDAINEVLLGTDVKIINAFLDVVAKYGTPEEINAKAEEARKLENLFKKVEAVKPEYLQDLEWLMEQRDKGAFIGVNEYRQKIFLQGTFPHRN